MIAIAVALAVTVFDPTGLDSTSCGRRGPAGREEARPVRVSLQVMPSAPKTAGLIDLLVEEAAAIWAPYNVAVAVQRGGSDGNDRQGHVLKLFVRNAATNRVDGKPTAGHHGLAAITFVDGVPQPVMYASVETALEVVRAAQLHRLPERIQKRYLAQLLGRAVAHELGHYLLGSKAHSVAGLMRTMFHKADLLATGHKAFRLEPGQAAALVIDCDAQLSTHAQPGGQVVRSERHHADGAGGDAARAPRISGNSPRLLPSAD